MDVWITFMTRQMGKTVHHLSIALNFIPSCEHLHSHLLLFEENNGSNSPGH
jgi:hypothetical protein